MGKRVKRGGGRPIGSFYPGSQSSRVLAHIEQHPGATLSEIVTATGLAKGAASSTADRLTKTGLVVRARVPSAGAVRGRRVWFYTAAHRVDKRRFRVWTVVRFAVDVEVEATNQTEAAQTVKGMDPMELVSRAGKPEIEIEDCVGGP